jgi:CHAT domain-containing protein
MPDEFRRKRKLTKHSNIQYTFVVRKDRATFFRAPQKDKDIAGIVTSLRDSLDRRGRLPVEMPPFDTAKAYALYHQLLAPAEPLLAGATSLIIVPDGALQSLPPAVLVTEAPHAPITGVANYKPVPWLARRYALTVLPAVSSLTSLRRFAEARHASKPFIGFGDPDFKGAKEGIKDSRREDIQMVSLFRGGAANVDGLRRLCPTPPANCKPRRRLSARRPPASI